MGGRRDRMTRLTQWILPTRLTQRAPPRQPVQILVALVVIGCLMAITGLNSTQNEPVPARRRRPSPPALRQLRLSVSAGSPISGTVEPVPPEALRSCLSSGRRQPLTLLFAGHSRVWQLFWAAAARSGAQLRSRAAPAHGPPYGGDPPPPPPADTPDTCVEMFRRPAGDRRPPACSWAADAPGLQLDLRWRLRVDDQLGRLLSQAAEPANKPDLLVTAVALKETVREGALLRAPQALRDSLRRHLVSPLRRLTAAGVTSVLLLDYPPNRRRAAVPYDRGAGAVTLVQNAIIMQEVTQIPDLHIWTSPMPSVIDFYTGTCQQPENTLDPETVNKCSNDTFHPGPRVVDRLLDQLLHVVCG